MTQIGSAYIKVLIDTAETKRGLDKSRGSIMKWGKSLAIAGGAGAAIGIVTNFLVDSVKAAQESERVNANLQRQVEATGASYETYQKQIDDTITATSNLAAVDDEDLAESFTKLVGSTGDVNDALAGMQAAADVAAARGISLETATKAIEKAMTGSTAGLKKFGIQLDKNADRQQVLEALQKRFGGAAEAYGKTAAGAQQRFGIALENVKEQIGTALLPMVTKFFNAVSDGLVWWQANWPAIQKAIADSYRIAKPILDSLITQIRFVATIVADVAKLVAAIVRGDWSGAWKAFKELAVDYITGLLTVIENLPIVRAVRAVIDKMLGALRGAVDEVKRAAGKVGDAIVDGVMAYLDFYVRLGTTIVSQIGKAANWVVNNFGTPFARLVALIADKVSQVVDFGVSLGGKILAGIKSAATWVISRVGDAFSGLGTAIKNAVLGQLSGITDWIIEKIKGTIPGPLRGFVSGALGVVGRSAPASQGAVAAGSGGGGASGFALGASGGGTLGSGTSSVGALGVSGIGSRLPTVEPIAVNVEVYIGETELTTLVNRVVVAGNTRIARTLLAGAR